MFESLFADFYWSSVISQVGRLQKEVVIGVAASVAVVTMHKQYCDSKVKVAEAQARKAEAERDTAKIKTFTVES